MLFIYLFCDNYTLSQLFNICICDPTIIIDKIHKSTHSVFLKRGLQEILINKRADRSSPVGCLGYLRPGSSFLIRSAQSGLNKLTCLLLKWVSLRTNYVNWTVFQTMLFWPETTNGVLLVISAPQNGIWYFCNYFPWLIVYITDKYIINQVIYH